MRTQTSDDKSHASKSEARLGSGLCYFIQTEIEGGGEGNVSDYGIISPRKFWGNISCLHLLNISGEFVYGFLHQLKAKSFY